MEKFHDVNPKDKIALFDQHEEGGNFGYKIVQKRKEEHRHKHHCNHGDDQGSQSFLR